MGSGADHVGRADMPESMIVGLDGCSSASRTSNECEPLQVTGNDASTLNHLAFAPGGSGMCVGWMTQSAEISR